MVRPPRLAARVLVRNGANRFASTNRILIGLLVRIYRSSPCLTQCIGGALCWNRSPADPYLYNLTVTLTTLDVETDVVESYAALRTVGKLRSQERTRQVKQLSHDAGATHSDITRLLLNGNYTYLLGTLDQGFWCARAYAVASSSRFCSLHLSLTVL